MQQKGEAMENFLQKSCFQFYWNVTTRESISYIAKFENCFVFFPVIEQSSLGETRYGFFRAKQIQEVSLSEF